MFLLKTKYRKDILVLLIASILLGTGLVMLGGFIADNYFVNMVSGMIGDYGEYDMLFILSSEKEEIALEQIKNIAADTLPGSEFKTGPKVAGSSNYLLKIPEEYKTEDVYVSLGKYFDDIPGLVSTNIMTEPRLSLRGFRGDSLPIIREKVETVNGINFTYPTSDGIDIIVEKPELVPDVKKQVTQIINNYKLVEIKYPLNQHPDDLPKLRKDVIGLVENDVEQVIDVTQNNDSGRVSLLTSLKQMKSFLLSYASKVIIETDDIDNIMEGTKLAAETEEQRLDLKVIEVTKEQVTALIQNGDLKPEQQQLDVYLTDRKGTKASFLAEGTINNPRQELSVALNKLNEITPSLNGFLDQSQELVKFSERLGKDLGNVNQGLDQLEETSKELSSSLEEWEKEGLSSFLGELMVILDDIKTNAGDITDIQRDLIQTSNKLKEGAGLIEERLIYVPRNNSIYQQLEDLKNVFLQLADGLDNNYDLVSDRLSEMDPVLSSIDDWQNKIDSLLNVEDSLTSGADWAKVDEIMNEVDKTAETINTSQIQQRLDEVQEVLVELQTTQLPVVVEQLSYIQNSLPDLKEAEIVETLNLIDSYIAGQVIPGDQVQLLIRGNYDSQKILEEIKNYISNPAVSQIEMDAGMLQPNPRGEVFNVLRQVKAVISIIIAFVFTILVMIFDQTLIISVLRLNNGNGYLYGFITGGLIFSLICLISGIQFPYLDLKTEFLIGGILGLIVTLLAGMINPVSREEWEAGKALGFSPAEIMHEIMIPAGKPGLLYLLNYPKITLK